MSFSEQPEQPDPLKRIREIIETAPREIEAEFFRSLENNWLKCLGSVVTGLSLQLHMAQGLIASAKFERAEKQLDELHDRAEELQSQYPSREISPPDSIKQELIGSLDILKD